MPSTKDQVLLTLRTVRHLRARQLAWRVLYRVRPRPRARAGAPPPPRPLGRWVEPIDKGVTVGDGPAFAFLGVARRYPDGVRWRDPEPEKLWLYNLHYFDYLPHVPSAAGAAVPAEALVADWIAANPHGEGDGWEPYPTSLRIVNWIKWMVASGHRDPTTLASLALQVRWLERNLEHHILANHLFANAKALLFAGLFFGGEEGDGWRDAGLGLVGAELREQVLPDGGHYERSPMYHAILLEDVLDLANLGAATGAVDAARTGAWRRTAREMLRWLGAMSHPDGRIGFFNDAAFDIAPEADALGRYAARLDAAPVGAAGPPADEGASPEDAPGRSPAAGGPVTDGALVHLAASGYVRLAAGDATLLVDAAPVGPDHQPGHAHADTLSFELSRGDGRVLVNSGTSTYVQGPERQRQRSTRAHNTVEVDGADSSEVWAGFRVARRARVHGASVETRGEELVATAAHDGYRRLPGRVGHRRRWSLTPERLLVTDTLTGRWRTARARFHLHPRLRAHADGRVTGPGGTLGRWEAGGGRASVEASTWHPRFGASEANQCIVVAIERDESTFALRFEGP